MGLKTKMRAWAVVSLFLVAASAGCDGPGDSGSSAGGSGGDGGAGGGGAGGGGAGGIACYWSAECYATILYPGQCSALGTPTGVQDEASARCALEHLRDGTAALVTLDHTSTTVYGPGYCGLRQDLHVGQGRMADLVEVDYLDLGKATIGGRAELKAPDFYQGCLDSGPTAYASCLADAFMDVDGGSVCE